ncbi:MAG: tetratricopeptide repeat protein [Proteobacteria bacterium]|nr:tetratricopeptide repeat protein [Pseudomonadota bacterium]MBI3497846.1 tetratricopeptide repeat protein [Pseudomonadota bacterium]
MSQSDEFVREVEEDLRKEHYQRLWDRYGRYVVALAVVLVLAVAGFNLWRDWRERQREAASAQLAEALANAQTNPEQAANALGALADKSSPGFAALARLNEAALLINKGDREGALRVYDTLAADSSADPALRDLGVVLGVMHRIDAGDPAQLSQRLALLIGAGNPWRFNALELTAVLAVKSGDKARASELFRKLADDTEAPANIRARAAEMLAALAG